MRSILICVISLVGVFFMSASQSGKADKSSGRTRPNIIYVMADQLRYDVLGYSGDKKARTPNLDKLAAESLNFKNAVSVSPVCAPHRASLLTGKFTSSTGMVINELRLNPRQRSWAHILTENGYQTSYIGKWHLYSNCSRHDDVECAYIPPGEHRMGFDGEWKSYNFHHSNFQGYYFEDTPEKIYYEKPFEPEAQFDLALEFIDWASQKEEPFAMLLSIGSPHDPWVPDNVPASYLEHFKEEPFPLPSNWNDVPDKYMDRNTDPERWLNHWKIELPGFKRVYYAMVAHIDRSMGRLMKKLEEKGIEDNTILIFSSDHGEMFGENGRVYKLTFYESAARVPFLMRWPGKIKPGSTDVLLNTPDVMPTVLSLMGLKEQIPEAVEGMDLSHVCRGETGEEPEAAFLQGMGHTYLWEDGYEWRAVRDKRFTYARYLIDGKELLFDNENNPLQTVNLINDPNYGAEVKRLSSFMDQKMTELKDEFQPCTWYRDNWVDENRNIIRSAQGAF